jgi:pimeloyl-ACP methyl ester carboxylesterase
MEAVHATETATIKAPTLILWSDCNDFLPRSDQDALAKAIPGSRLVVYEGTGHVVHWEQPRRVAADLVALMERVRPRHSLGGCRQIEAPALSGRPLGIER